MKKLQDLLKYLNPIFVRGNLERVITGVAYDSRKVNNGNIFVCIEGFKTDGHLFIKQAQENGAQVMVIQKEIECLDDVTVIRVEDTRLALALLAAAFYDFPGKKLSMIGVTGTNGKTTTTYLLTSILKYLGKKTGLIGTIHNFIGDKIVATEHTTPESSDLQQLLAQMLKEDVTDVTMEVSSHALALKRIEGLFFKGAIFTNLTQDHLDFHQTMEEYFLAKAKFFTSYLASDRINVINIDDRYGQRLIKIAGGRIVTYGIRNEEAEFRAKNIKLYSNGISYRVCYPEGEFDLRLKLLGEFNVYNSLAVIAYAISSGINPEDIKDALEKAEGVPGRFQIIDKGQPFAVAVDYAHTPDGLENILSSARQFTQGRIITVFGCGGDRDRTKRPQMGAIAAAQSDIVIVTSDNPRSEEPAAIIDEILNGITDDSKAIVYSEVDRRTAIKNAIKMAVPGDMVIIAGKGHEDYQIIKGEVLHFDDSEEAALALKEIGYESEFK